MKYMKGVSGTDSELVEVRTVLLTLVEFDFHKQKNSLDSECQKVLDSWI